MKSGAQIFDLMFQLTKPNKPEKLSDSMNQIFQALRHKWNYCLLQFESLQACDKTTSKIKLSLEMFGWKHLLIGSCIYEHFEPEDTDNSRKEFGKQPANEGSTIKNLHLIL